MEAEGIPARDIVEELEDIVATESAEAQEEAAEFAVDFAELDPATEIRNNIANVQRFLNTPGITIRQRIQYTNRLQELQESLRRELQGSLRTDLVRPPLTYNVRNLPVVAAPVRVQAPPSPVPEPISPLISEDNARRAAAAARISAL